MEKTYNQGVLLFKALSDFNRLMIVDMLSCGELCACVILEKLNITQPTLSHHMKTLCDSGLVHGRKEGKWTYYSLDNEVTKNLLSLLEEVTTPKQNCICNEITCKIECK
jgi:ArsR family transcriptional regulator